MSQALTFPVPAAGSLDQYIQSVNRMPMLSEQQEVELATRLRDEGDVDAARQLVMSHLRVVVAIARGGTPCCLIRAAAVPTACPISAHVAMTRVVPSATCVTLIFRPAIMRLSMFFE